MIARGKILDLNTLVASGLRIISTSQGTQVVRQESQSQRLLSTTKSQEQTNPTQAFNADG